MEVVDTTGAGDVFAGVLAVGLVEPRPAVRPSGLASAAAGLSVTRWGARGLRPADAPAVRELASRMTPQR